MGFNPDEGILRLASLKIKGEENNPNLRLELANILESQDIVFNLHNDLNISLMVNELNGWSRPGYGGFYECSFYDLISGRFKKK